MYKKYFFTRQNADCNSHRKNSYDSNERKVKVGRRGPFTHQVTGGERK